MYQSILNIAQLVLAVFLVIVVLLQQRGSGLGATFGGSSAVYNTKRGIDKVLFQVTIVTSILFFAISLLRVVIA